MKNVVQISALSLLLSALVASAQTGPLSNGYIYTYAGNGIPYSDGGDGGQATSAEIWGPDGVVTDPVGNLYITDNSSVRKVEAATGIITTVAGNGIPGFNGDGGPAIDAEFDRPVGIALDAFGNLFIADWENNRIRKVDASTGIVTTVAGNGTNGFSGDGESATSAELFFPEDVALDAAGNLYIADTSNERIRKVNAVTGIITTVAGSSNAPTIGDGDGGPATSATLTLPEGVALDTAGNLYIGDTYDNRVRKVDAVTGIITTVAGTGTAGYSGDGGAATSADLTFPCGLVLDAPGNIYIVDSINNRIRRVDAVSGIITTVAGDGPTGDGGYSGDGGLAIDAELANPFGVTLDPAGNLYIADTFNYRIRIVRPTALIATTTALIANPTDLNVDESLTLTATVTPAGGGAATGTVTFSNGTTSLGNATLNSSGVATLMLTPGAGNYSVTASYNGSSTDAPSQSAPPVLVTVTGIATTTSLTASATSLPFGQTLTLTATVNSESGGTPTGSVTFFNGTTSLGSGTLNGSSVATLNTTSLPIGNDSITAVYSGDSNFAASTSSAIPIAITTSDLGEWTWMGGSSTVPAYQEGQPGVYGTLGTPAAGNVPGGREWAASWTDNSGHLWLFGGNGYDANGDGAFLNDLWEFNPSLGSYGEWTWMGGNSTVGSSEGWPGIYGTLGTPAAANIPGGRNSAVSWTDSKGHLWLFGGTGYDANGVFGSLNDLWEFNPSLGSFGEWTWMGGSSTVPGYKEGQSGIYGTLGTPAAGNIPGGRQWAVSWIDNSGHLWLFGGLGYDADNDYDYLNDLWEFNPSLGSYGEWAWMGGSSTVGSSGGRPGVYGTLGAPAAANIPGGRQWAVSWTGNSGHLWLFGGSGYDTGGQFGYLNDLWEFDPSLGSHGEWAWMGGSSTVPGYEGGQPGVYGTLGTPAATNIPGGRGDDTSWTDSSGNFWLFGGSGSDATSNVGFLNDLWEFNPSLGSYGEWTWMNASSTMVNQPGVYGTLGTPAAANIPGGRYGATGWAGSDGNLWLFGGGGLDANNNWGHLNDLWVYGLVPKLPAAAPPTFNPPAGTYAAAQNVTITDTTPSATIFYTTNGTTPSTNSSVYNNPIDVSSSETLEAIAAAAGYSTSAVATAAYTIAVPTTTTLTASSNPAPFGTTVTFTATVSSSAKAPTGNVSFYDGTTLLATETLASGVATYSSSTLSVGSHNITADYAATADFNASTSNLVVEVISPADFGISAAPDSQTVYTGEAATYTVSIAPGTGFALPVTLSCTQLPANSSCSFSPATITGGAWSSTLVVQTTPPSPATTTSFLSSRLRVTALAGLFLLILPSRLRRYRKGWPLLLVILAILASGAAITGCSAPGSLTGATPLGAQTVTVTGIATNGTQTLTHTANVTLNVNSLF